MSAVYEWSAWRPWRSAGSPAPRFYAASRFSRSVQDAKRTVSRMTIREIVETDRPDWVRLRESLWPGSLPDHDSETREYFHDRARTSVVFVAEVDGQVVGFLE